MRETARKLVAAHLAGKPKTVGNSAVRDGVFTLHGNPIVRVEAGRVEVSLAGWPTVTTRSRINDILSGLRIDARVSQMAFSQYLTGHGAIESREWYWVGTV